jgi:hypothetical protein
LMLDAYLCLIKKLNLFHYTTNYFKIVEKSLNSVKKCYFIVRFLNFLMF